MSTAKVVCTCKNEYQDKHYGQNVRVANGTMKKAPSSNETVVRCTVCSKEHTVNNSRVTT